MSFPSFFHPCRLSFFTSFTSNLSSLSISVPVFLSLSLSFLNDISLFETFWAIDRSIDRFNVQSFTVMPFVFKNHNFRIYSSINSKNFTAANDNSNNSCCCCCSRCYKTFVEGNLDFPKIKKLKKICDNVWTCTKMWKQCTICNQNYTIELFNFFKISYTCCFGFRWNLEFPDFY